MLQWKWITIICISGLYVMYVYLSQSYTAKPKATEKIMIEVESEKKKDKRLKVTVFWWRQQNWWRCPSYRTDGEKKIPQILWYPLDKNLRTQLMEMF